MTGFLFALSLEVMWIPFVVYGALLVLQLWTRSSIPLQVLEVWAMSMALVVGVYLGHRWGTGDFPSRPNPLHLFGGGAAWALLGSGVAVLATMIRVQIEKRLLRRR